MKDRCLLSSCLVFPLFKTFNPEHTNQFKLADDPKLNKVKDILIKQTILGSLSGDLRTFRDTNKKFKLEGDVLKTITNKNYNVDISKIWDEKLLLIIAKQLCFVEKASCNQSNRNRSLYGLLESPAAMAGSREEQFIPKISRTK